ncbi:hypothetical protein [Streptosporangium amethystogenes]|uniref:hypothetical protein n=1 Tax=Streptosporangium amethystogenes TaxID=2002 RepID=UPI001B80BBD1|nr:hypothetical protein [Streptosporangium amethystogenes]
MPRLRPPPGRSALGGRTPSFEICPCCGVEFGYEDATPQAVSAHRRDWLAAGATWSAPSREPPGWDLERQLRDAGLLEA